ncbi:PadR family transcriptional regulator [uncultured Slackia sp.]|uniref:PadR family transcriptional regulator n=1 Tax=uncultured Slackia sp. TaxID=665903 RepID=UPI002622E0C4|nr:PadR family transcriptional regulator [uncultured Slackia sp.]
MVDAQMKRGFLEACVLSTLCRKESYGYRIVKDVPDILGLTESTLYPLLKRLEAAESISVRAVEHNGRLRKYYRTTEKGRIVLESFLREKQEVMQIYRYIEDAAGGEHVSCGERGRGRRTAGDEREGETRE